MPYANNNGINIYYEVEGQGPPLVLAHGMGLDLSSWERYGGYVTALKSDFTLVMFDFMGHGRSDKPHEPATYREWMQRDALAVMDDFGIGRAHYFGYSMGAAVGFLTAARHPGRFYSLVLGGASPFPNDARAKRASDAMEGQRLWLTDPLQALENRERALGRPLGPVERAAMLANDAQARIAMLEAGIPFLSFLDDDDLSNMTMPCLVFCGELDPDYASARESVPHMPRADFVPFLGLNHVQAGVRSDLVLPHVKEFLAEVSNK